MANYPGTPNDDLLQGTTADDVYTNIGVGIDNVKDPGGKNTIDISGATVGAIVDLSPGQTSTLATGSFTLGSLIVGNNPDIVFVADISGSTSLTAAGVAVGDLNKDGVANTILDGEIAGFIALNQSLIDRGLGDTARVSLIAFDDTAAQVGTTITPKTDANNNGIFDIVESLNTLRDNGSTNYEAAMIAAQGVFTRLATPPGKGNLIFLSDGAPNSTTSYLDEVAALKASGYNLRAFGVGNGIPLAPLQSIDPTAATFTTTDQLVKAFTLQGGSGSSTETSIETFISTNFDDNISGNILSNKIDAGAGNDIIAGVNPKAANPGVGEIDTLTGGAGKDTFVLGDGSKVYYDDGSVTTPGLADYALITDFNTSQGDLVKLSGLLSQYSLDNSPIVGINGQALFLNKPSGEPRELIAIFQNSTGLTIDGILGLPVVTIASGINAAEPATNGTFTLTRTGDLAAALTVNLATPTGTATSGVDYTALAPTATFAVGSATSTVTVATIDDAIVEPTETIGLSLATGASYTLGTTTAATINLTDNDVAPIVLPSVTIASGINAAEPATNGTFTLTRTGNLTTALTVNLATPTGTATSGVDYTALAPTATFAVGSATSTVTVATIDDMHVEPTETIGLALSVGAGYTLGTTTAASINLIDNDVVLVEDHDNDCPYPDDTSDHYHDVADHGHDYSHPDDTSDHYHDVADRGHDYSDHDDTSDHYHDDTSNHGHDYSHHDDTSDHYHDVAASQPSTRNDFNGNNKSDILWRNDNGNIALWQMKGATVKSSSLTSVSNLDSSWKVSGTGDFNGDSKSDILWRNTNGAVVVWTMDGATVKSSSLASTPSLDNSWKTVGTGDYNGDGKSDILWRNTNGAVVVWAMDGATVKSSTKTSTSSLDSSWKVAGNSDFNGDGKSDILWRNDDGSVALWQMNGSAITASTTVAKLSADWKIAGTGDFNGDNKADILWRNDNGSVALWQMNGAAITSSTQTSTSSLDNSWTVTGIGDYNGDGKSDISWRNTSGAAVVWTMDGAAVTSSLLTSAAADNSWKIAAPII
jgi:FG-GAP-like repeat/Calx-beta domain/von Willebrand factor type A domain